MRPLLLREDGTATLESTLMIVILLPLLFAVLQFGDAYQRWLAQESATVQAARHAAEIGGDHAEVRARLREALISSGIDADHVSVAFEPARVSWREPIRVTVLSEFDLAIPFLLSTRIPLRSVAIARGEVNR